MKSAVSFLAASLVSAGRAPTSDGLRELDIISERIDRAISFGVEPFHPEYAHFDAKKQRLDNLFRRLKGRARRIDGVCWPETLFDEEEEVEERSVDVCTVLPRLVKRVKPRGCKFKKRYP
ncbi:Oidioi.mRNA.OKI2018_I69.XSR.g13341.t1.cds [Oikopleura dioica]|uniref:Oidioi.mRNA.OKI2018_I69.XSR.g13341.t1.cds n=1 Tax=Oikopleura dioica TaxID=34765 RepID=A0ABN7SB91_OIKDI|nr:Oidioi.mRNA.OKI2018_I69.XSR.g13341.t1.cds [Oikopleura dioica]